MPRRSCDWRSARKRSKIFCGEPGFFADFVETRRSGRSREKLKNRSPHAVLHWIKSLIPFSGETKSRGIALLEGLSRC